jgi:hypothetical protein
VATITTRCLLRVTGVTFGLLVSLIGVSRVEARHAEPPSENAPPPLRTVDRSLMDVVAQGLARSATLRALQAHLRQSRAIVYISRTFLPPGVAGRTRITGMGDGWRYFSVELDCRQSRIDLVAMLGHELEHVSEMVDAGSVIDGPSMLAFYRRIGDERSHFQAAVPAFETAGAIAVGQRVYNEVFSQGW